jgi:hypothetical protein
MKLTRYDLDGTKHVYEGEPVDIHPYDFGALLEDTVAPEIVTLPVQILVVNGTLYNQTVEIPAVTTRYA